MKHDVKEQIGRSLIWSAASTVTPPLVQSLRTIILARFLAPADFGLMSMAMAIIMFLEIFQQGGLGQAVIQHRGRPEDAANVSFWAQLAISSLIFSMLWLGAPSISGIAKNPELINVLRVMSFALFSSPFVNIPASLMIRNLRFRGVFHRQVAPLLASSLLSIILACLDYGVWSLVIGHLAGSYVSALIFLFHWRPRFSISLPLIKDLFTFGGHIVVQGMLLWASGILFKFLIGTFQGTTILGYLNIADNLALRPVLSITASLAAVMFPAFSQLERDGQDLKAVYLVSLQRLTLIGIPLSATLFFLCPSLVHVLLGEKWLPAITPVRILLIVAAMANIVGLNAEIYKAMGLPGIITKLMLFRTVIFVPLFFYTSRQNLIIFLWSYLLGAGSTHLLNVYVMLKVMAIPVKELLLRLKPAFLVTAGLSGLGMAGQFSIPMGVRQHAIGLLLQAGLACVFYVIFVRIFDRESYSAAADFIRSIIVHRRESA